MGCASPDAIRFAAGDRTLEGRWWHGATGGAVIAPPHPEYGGRLDHPVVSTVATALARRDVPCLAFNWSGIGASEGRVTGDLARAEADYAAALDELARLGGGPPVTAAGYSFGAATALRLASRVARLLLIAPPVALLGADALRRCGRPVGVIVGDDDAFAPAAQLPSLVPAGPECVLTVLPNVDHFFATDGALVRLADALEGMLG